MCHLFATCLAGLAPAAAGAGPTTTRRWFRCFHRARTLARSPRRRPRRRLAEPPTERGGRRRRGRGAGPRRRALRGAQGRGSPAARRGRRAQAGHHAVRLRRLRLLRAAGRRHRLRPGSRAADDARFSRSTRAATAGCSWATCWRRRSTRAARPRTSAIRRASNRYDSINSNGAPGFIVNEVNLTLTRRAGRERRSATAASTSCPRTGNDFRLGDVFDVDIAPLEWLLGARAADVDLRRQVRPGVRHRVPRAQGEPALRHHAVADRALHDRHAAGHQGAQPVRRQRLVLLAGALTNGSSTTEQFHFYDEIDSNAGKTASGRLAFALPLPVRIELGVSGIYGAQDRAPDSPHPIWFQGADLQLLTSRCPAQGRVLARAQRRRGRRGRGRRASRVYGLI